LEINENIGHQIRYYRKKMNLTQQELADKVGVTWEMISRYERGSSLPMYKISELAEALNVEPAHLFGDSPESNTGGPKKKADTNNRIPLFTKIPENLEFSFNSTTFAYNAPDWIIKQYSHPFALEPNIVEIQKIQIHDTGVIYIAGDEKCKKEELALFAKDEKLVINTCSSMEKGEKYIGKVIAQEIRF
jgi:transcriptional regulator with XRE-family HTH domain